MDSSSNRSRRHSSCDMSITELGLKRSRVQDCIKGQSKFAVWRNRQESICQALTPNWAVPHDIRKRSSTTDLDTFSADIEERSKSTQLIQSFESFRAAKGLADGQETEQVANPETPEPAARNTNAGDLFEVADPRYHDVGLLLTLGESNSPCSKVDRADMDLALVFKHTHFT
jgi:hypothetical protein